MELFPLLGDSVAFGLAIMFIVLGLIGTIVPLLPGSLLIWITLLVYCLADGFATPSPLLFAFMTLILFVTGSAEIWMPLFGAKAGGGSKQSLIFGVIGGILGLIFFPPLGSIIGYAVGILLGAYRTHKDWNKAIKASLGGLAGQGIASLIQLGGGLIALILFVFSVMSA